MNINQTLQIIKAKCNDFSNLPNSMKNHINKDEIKNYLLNTLKIDLNTIQNFLDLIYDDNEEDKNKVSTKHFIEKYNSLLKIIDNNEIEDENKKEKNINENTGNEEIKEIGFKGSPIRNDILNKFDEDNSIDPNELFKEINFKNDNFQKKSYNSIIRPSNNFNLGSLNNLKVSNDIIKKEGNQKRNNEEKKINTKFKSIINNNSNQNILNNIFNNQRQNTINQKLQDVFFQIHKSNDIKNYNIYPFNNSSKYNSTHNINKNTYKNYIPSPRKIDNNALLQIHNKITNINHYSPLKNNKINYNNNIYNLSKSNNLKKYSRNNDINRKLEGLNKILFDKDLDKINQGKNILNPDDFYTLEEKIIQFEKKKIENKKKKTNIFEKEDK